MRRILYTMGFGAGKAFAWLCRPLAWAFAGLFDALLGEKFSPRNADDGTYL
jgi:hypothetical protein